MTRGELTCEVRVLYLKQKVEANATRDAYTAVDQNQGL